MRTALALAAAATLAGTGLVAAPASARTFVSVGIGAPIYSPYPAYYGGYPPPYYGPSYYGPPPVYRGYWVLRAIGNASITDGRSTGAKVEDGGASAAGSLTR
jgi:hypothetical protein